MNRCSKLKNIHQFNLETLLAVFTFPLTITVRHNKTVNTSYILNFPKRKMMDFVFWRNLKHRRSRAYGYFFN